MFKKLLRDCEETLVIAADGSTDLNYTLVSHGVVEILVFLLLTLDVLWLEGPKRR
jgi:hypothetical protein